MVVFWLVVAAVVIGSSAAAIVAQRRRRGQLEAMFSTEGAASAHAQLAGGTRDVVPPERGGAYKSGKRW